MPEITTPAPQEEYDIVEEASEPIAAPDAETPLKVEAGSPEGQGAPSRHPAYLLSLASRFEIPQADLDAMSTDQLGTMLAHLDRVARANSPSAPSVNQAPPPPTVEEDALDLGIDPETRQPIREDQLAPGLVNVLKAQAKQISELSKKLQQSEQGTFAQKADLGFAALGDSFHTVIGKGDLEAIQNNPAYVNSLPAYIARRQAIIQQAAQMAGPSATHGQIAALIPQAAQTLFGMALSAPSQQTPSAPAPVASYAAPPSGHVSRGDPEKLKAWQNGSLAAPTHRQSPPPPKGDERALKGISDLMAKKGIPSVIEQSEYEGIPD